MLEWITVFLCTLYLVVLLIGRKREDLNSLKTSICVVVAVINIILAWYGLAAMWVCLALCWILEEKRKGR